jgi:DNA-binding LacI/PurR family transcriptional regulator
LHEELGLRKGLVAVTRVAGYESRPASNGTDMPERPRNSRVTIKTVAKDAGVSVAAVSRVLRDAYGVSSTLRDKVLASIKSLNYRPHTAARGMRGQTYTLGVLLPDLRNPFFADIMAGVNDALERTQYQALLGIGQSAETLEHALVESMIDRQMDGLVLIAPRSRLDDLVRIAERVPVVTIGLHEPAVEAFDTVNNDDELGARLVVHHLFECGYRNITYFSLKLHEDLVDATVVYRERGYVSAMRELGLEKNIRVVPAEQTGREAQAVARQLLSSNNPPDAIFCWTDFVAFQVQSVARQLGFGAPGSLAIVGYDNTSYCELEAISLTSIDQSGQVLGLQAARLLIERIKGRDRAEHFVVTPRLVARSSSAPRA